MSNKLFTLLLSSSFLLLTVVPVSALEDTMEAPAKTMEMPSSEKLDTAPPKKAKLASKSAQLTQKMDAKEEKLMDRMASKEAVMEKFDEVRVAQIKLMGTRMLTRIQAALSRLENILGRIESRMAKIESVKKRSTTSFAARVKKVKTQLETAKTTLDQARAELEAIETSEDPKTALETMKSKVGASRDALKAARTEMIALITAIGKIEPKELQEEEEATASATPSAGTATSSATSETTAN